MKGKFYVGVLIGILACGEAPLEGTLDAGPADAGPCLLYTSDAADE